MVYGVPMPRSYLELTMSPKENEVDHPITASFNSDILLIPISPPFEPFPGLSRPLVSFVILVPSQGSLCAPLLALLLS